MVAFILGIGLGIGATRYYHHFFDPVKYQAQPLLKYIENLRVSYRSQPEVPGINVLCYDKAAVKFVSPVFYKLDLRKDSQELHSNESKELCFDDFFRFTGFSQRILVQGRPGSGKTTLVNRLTKEWLNQTKNSNIAEYPHLGVSYFCKCHPILFLYFYKSHPILFLYFCKSHPILFLYFCKSHP